MNKLTINIEKSCYIIIDNINKHYFDNNIYIDNKLLNRVECYTFLGMSPTFVIERHYGIAISDRTDSFDVGPGTRMLRPSSASRPRQTHLASDAEMLV